MIAFKIGAVTTLKHIMPDSELACEVERHTLKSCRNTYEAVF